MKTDEYTTPAGEIKETVEGLIRSYRIASGGAFYIFAIIAALALCLGVILITESGAVLGKGN